MRDTVGTSERGLLRPLGPTGSAEVSPVGVAPRTRLTSVAWLAHVSLTLDEWQAQGGRLGIASRSTNWWLGDWLRFGIARYGQKYAIGSGLTGYDEHTLMNMVYVASRFKISRRREHVSWSHHAELAALDESEQEHRLDRVGAEELSIRRLRTELRTMRSRQSGRRVSQLDAQAGFACPRCGYRADQA